MIKTSLKISEVQMGGLNYRVRIEQNKYVSPTGVLEGSTRTNISPTVLYQRIDKQSQTCGRHARLATPLLAGLAKPRCTQGWRLLSLVYNSVKDPSRKENYLPKTRIKFLNNFLSEIKFIRFSNLFNHANNIKFRNNSWESI